MTLEKLLNSKRLEMIIKNKASVNAHILYVPSSVVFSAIRSDSQRKNT